jgi:hypothetical protein
MIGLALVTAVLCGVLGLVLGVAEQRRLLSLSKILSITADKNPLPPTPG